MTSLMCLINAISQKRQNCMVYPHLSGINIVIDPGHGGNDNGAIYNDVLEDEINLKISLFLLELCLENSMVATITRTDDYDLAGLYAKNRKNEDLKKRVQYINKINPDVFVSIHLNSYVKNESVHGSMIYFRSNDEKSKRLATCINEKLKILNDKEKIVHEGDFYLLNKTKTTGVFIECGFLSNEKERNKLTNTHYQKSIAQHILSGIDFYFL